MIINSSIFGGSYTSVNEQNQKSIVDFFNSCINNKYCNVSITISNKTCKKYYDKLVDMFGDNFEHYLTVVPDAKIKAGYIKIAGTDMRIGAKKGYKTLTLQVFVKCAEYNLESLKSEIMLNNPTFLITNLATWEQISKEDYDNVDQYANGSAYYHSYCKVPVAICEMVNPNMVKIVV